MALVSTAYTETTFTLASANQTLAVTPTGSITNDNGGVAIDATGQYDQISVAGFIYSAGSGLGDGVEVTGFGATVNVDALVQGATGVFFDSSGGDSLTIGAKGSVEGLSHAAVEFLATGGSASSFTLSNAGAISSAMNENVAAVVVEDGGYDLISNSGQISGTVGVSFSYAVDLETIENSGTITGGGDDNAAAVRSQNSAAGVDIVNSGLISDAATNALGGTSALLWFDDAVGAISTIDNQGTISGAGYVIQSLDDSLDISNSGRIHGGLYSTASVNVHNSGAWAGQASSAVTVFDLMAGGDVVTNTRAGAIDGGLTLVAGGDTITNAGSIDGAITFTGAGAANTLTNSGTISGDVSFVGAHSTLTNTGTVTGDLKLGASDTLVNHNEIQGDITAGSTNTLTNKGVIDGDLTLGAHDTVYVGDLTGVLNAKTNDLIEFSGNFGNQTINRFVAGSGSTADVLQFAANDFSSFAQVQAASTQQGSDAVIRLDAADSITLTGVTLSNLVAANFSFV